MLLALANVTTPDSLTVCPTETETINLDTALVSDAEAGTIFGKFLLPSGAYPAASTDVSLGIVYSVGEVDASPSVLCTVVTRGRHWALVQAGATITDNIELAVDTAGDVLPAVAGDTVVGRARNESTGSTAVLRHYVIVQLGTPYVKA